MNRQNEPTLKTVLTQYGVGAALTALTAIGILALIPNGSANEGPGEPTPQSSPQPSVDVPAMIAKSDADEMNKYSVSVSGEGHLRIQDNQNGSDVGVMSFVDLQISRTLNTGDAKTTAGFHARAFFDSKDVSNGNTPSMSTVLKLIEAYADYLPQGADGIHVFRVSGGNTWVAFGYGADERASFASFPMVSSMSTAGIGFSPNLTVRYENKQAGFVIDGSFFSPQENGSYLELENQGYSIRVRKGISITSHLKAEVMASYANLYYPTKEEREQRLAVGGKFKLDLESGVQVEGMAELFYNGRVSNRAAATEATAWMAMANVKKGRASLGMRYSRIDSGKSEYTVTGRYTVTKPKSRVQVDAMVEFGRQRARVNGVNTPSNKISVGLALRTQKRRK